MYPPIPMVAAMTATAIVLTKAASSIRHKMLPHTPSQLCQPICVKQQTQISFSQPFMLERSGADPSGQPAGASDCCKEAPLSVATFYLLFKACATKSLAQAPHD
jgi:hypothetical protein